MNNLNKINDLYKMIDPIKFCNPELKENGAYIKPKTKQEVLALAIAAQRINGEYLKRGGKSDFVTRIEDGEKVQRYTRIKESNRHVIQTLEEVVPNILEDTELLNAAQSMLDNLNMEFMFKVLGDNMNDFETSIHEFLAENDDELYIQKHMGVIAFIPEYVKRDTSKKELEERSVGSEYVGSKGDKVTIDIEIISKRQATAWAGWNVNAITSDGNRVSFFTTKDDLSEMTGIFSITAKVKDCGTVWDNSDIKETRLNYVK